MSHNLNESNIKNEELANACRKLGLSGPLENLLRGMKIESIEQKHESRNVNKKHEQKFTTNDGKKSYGQESWGKDSGARDLSPEIHKIPSTSGSGSQIGQVTDNELGSSSMLDLANKLQNAALSALKIEVEELTTRLRHSERERDLMQRKLNEALDEKEQVQKRINIVGTSHESRITELHCVIAELTKKLKGRQDNAIVEENEHDGSVSELSFQEGSVYNSEMEAANYDVESQTESLNVKLEQTQIINTNNNVGNSAQIQALQEEIIHLRVQVALLQSQLATDADNNINEKHIDNDEDVDNDNDDDDEDENYQDETISCNDDNLEENAEFMRHSKAKNVKTSSIDLPPTKDILPSVKLLGNIGLTNQQQTGEIPVTKMAERVRLRRTIEENHLTGTDMTSSGIFTTEIAEHLVSDILQTDDIDASFLQNELQRFQRRIENLRFQNSVLTLTLAECKGHCEKLYLLCGKYESNAISLHQALNYCDRCIEGYDVLLALVESRVAMLECEESADDSRKIAETVGRNLLFRLASESSIPVNSVGPWQNTDGICSNSGIDEIPWTDDDYLSLQNLVSKYKALRQLVQNTTVILEAPFYDNNIVEDVKEISGSVGIQRDNRRMDLETAVLMQELMSIREEVSEFKFRAEQADRGKVNAEQRAATLQEAVVYLKAQLDDTETLLAKANKNRTSYSESEHAVGIERELVDCLARESRLKARLQCLSGALENAAKSSEEKYTQVQNTVIELKQANLTLNQSFERCKRKYQKHLKSLEQKLLGIQMNKSQQSSLDESVSVPVPLKKGDDYVPETTL